MTDLAFIFITILVITALIYFLYKFMLGMEKGQSKDELQITAEEVVQQLNILYKEKKFNIIESLAKKYLENRQTHDEVRFILAKALYESGKIYEAIEQGQMLLKRKQKNIELKIFLANCYVKISKPLSAISLLKDVLDLDTNNGVAVKQLAELYFHNNQKISAIKMYKKLEDLVYSNQEKMNIKSLLAQMYLEFEEYESAIDEYKGILDIYPADIEIQKKLATVYALNGNHEILLELTDAIFQAHNSKEDDMWALETLADTYFALGDYEKSLEYLKLMEENPLSDKMQIRKKMAKIYVEKDEIDQGIEILTTLINENKGNRSNIELKKELAKSYEAKEDYESAINVYKAILDEAGVDVVPKLHREMSDLFSNWAMSLYRNGDNNDCFKKFSLAVQYNNENPEIYYRLGQINQSIKSYNEAVSHYKKAIDLDIGNPLYYFAIAECYSEMGSSYEEKKALLECLKYNDDLSNAKVFYKLAVIYDSQNDQFNSFDCIKKAIELDNDYVEARYKYALMLEHKGDRNGAITQYESILRLDPEHEHARTNLKMLSS